MPSQPYAVVGISQLVTMAGPERPRTQASLQDTGAIPSGTLLVKEGHIEAAGPAASIKIPSGYEVLDVGGRLVTPGLIDSHAHPVFAGNRSWEFEMRALGKSYQDIAKAGGGIRSTVEQTQRSSEDELLTASRVHLDWMLRCGTTTSEAKSGYGQSLEDELKMLRVMESLSSEGPIDLIATFLGPHAIPPRFEGDPSLCIQEIIEVMLPEVAKQGVARFVDIFVEDRYFTHDCARSFARAARGFGFGLRMHVDQLTDNGGAGLAAELNANTADHLEQTDGAGIAALASAHVQPVLLPASVYGLGLARYPEARKMIEAGLAVVLATDFNPGSAPTPSLPMAMSLACTQMEMTPAECLNAVTVNAAHSLGLSDRGSLEHGQRADFVVWDCQDFREIPYWFGLELAQAVFIRGELVLQK